MRNVEHVKLTADSNYIHVKWAVIEATVGSSLANSYAWIVCVSYGFDSKENLLGFKLTSDGYEKELVDGRPVKQDPYTGVDKTGMVGNIGEYRVVSLVDIEPYNRGGKIDFTPNIPIGWAYE